MYTVSQKNCAPFISTVTLQMLADFNNSFSVVTRNHFYIKLY